jgi:hypothetical protein
MAETTVSRSATWDAKTATFKTTTVVESFSAFPSFPSTSIDVTKEIVDGKYRTTYTEGGDATSGTPTGQTSSYSYQIHSSLSTEPLKTHQKFANGGSYALSSDDLDKVKKAEAGEITWKSISTGSGGLAKYATLWMQGIESYLNPSIHST